MNNRPGYETKQHTCPNCANDGALVPISKWIKRRGVSCVDSELMCQRCGIKWIEDGCDDGFSTHDNDEREC